MNNLPKAWLLALALGALACEGNAPSPHGERPGTASQSPISTSQAKSKVHTSTKVQRVVFVGKEHACDCTKKRLESGWAALEQALGDPPGVSVERLQADTQAEQVEPLRMQQPMMTLPAVYFLDQRDSVVELLQGEITAAQVSAVLKK